MPNIDLNGLPLSQGFVIAGGISGQLTNSIVAVGNLNGDAYADIIIAGPSASPLGRSGAGMVSVIWGQAQGQANIDPISEGTGFRIIGASEGDQLGKAIAVGDINGDGYGDLIVSAPIATTYINSITGTGRGGAGIVYVILGKASRFVDIDLANSTANLAFTINGAAANHNAGRALAVGDVNRDGFKDIVVGTYSKETYVIFGKSSGFRNIDLASWLSSAGFVISGSKLCDSNYYYYGYCNGVNIGDSLAVIDINKDGYSDMIIGASSISPGAARLNAGAIFVVYGHSGTANITLNDFRNYIGFNISGADSNNRLGGGAISVGDMNKDGYGDIAIGLSNLSPMSRDNAGGGYVILGGSNMANIDLANLQNYAGFSIYGANTYDSTGSAVCIGDINQDGFGDIIIGSYLASPLTRGLAGITSVLYGKATGFTNIDLNTLSSSQGFNIFGQFGSDYYVNSGTRSGYNLAAGDINGDNVTDMIIGGIYTTTVLSGPPGNFTLLPMKLPNISNPLLKSLPSIDLNGLSISKGFTIAGGISGQLTNGIVVVGNINADRYADIFIGGAGASPFGRTAAGMVSVIWGQAQGQANIDPISEGAGFRIIGASAGDRLGTAIAIGDINGDGYGDLIVSAPSATTYINAITGTGRSGAGIIYVLLGKASRFVDIDLANSPADLAFTINGATTGAGAGRALAVGDMNRDGFQDIVATNSQKLYVIFGRSTGFADIDLASFSSALGFVVSGSSVFNSYYYGIDVGDRLVAIDINKDGYSDMIIGASRAGPLGRGNAGAIFVVYGRASMEDIDLGYLNNATGLMIMGANAGDQLGGGSLAVGDVNKDGYGDIAIGQSNLAPMSRSYAGGGYILLGGPNMVDIDLANLKNYAGFNISGANAGDRTGSAVCIADINQDGFGDIIIGSYFASPLTRGQAGITSVLYGKATGFTNIDLNTLSSSQGFNIFGQSGQSTQSGYSLAAGDINGDNVTDIIIGGGYTTTVLSGPPGNFTLLPMKLPNISNPILKSLPSVDLNGLSISKGFTIAGGISGQLANGIVVAGNINADRYADIFIGGPSASPLSRTGAGMVSVIWGQAQGQANIDLISEGRGFRIIGASAGDRLGTAIAIGDINGDGYGDMIVSAPGATTYINSVTGTGRSGAGIIYVLLGKASRFVDIDLANPPVDLALTINGAAANTNAGRTLAIGDVNRDGFQDIIIATNSQKLYVIFGQSTGFADIDLASFSSDLAFVVSGSSVANNIYYYYGYGVTIGDSLATIDINKDGYSDMIIGAAGADSLGRGNAGAIFVVYGRASMGDIDLGYLNNETGLMIIGANGDQLGGGSLAVGDVNKDGYGDIAIGQSYLSPMSRNYAGGGYILFGGPNMVNIDLANLKNYAGFNISGANAYDYTGSAICIADINQDGFGDIIIGSYLASPLTRSEAGITSVLYGKATGFTNIDLNSLSASQGFNIFGQSGGYYATQSGYRLAAGDINGDNVTDIMIGGEYAATVLSGPLGNFTLLPMKLPNISNPILKPLPNVDLNGVSISKGFMIAGGISSQLTNGIVVVGNINADRYADIFIGGPSASPLGRTGAGMVSVIWGQAQGQANIDPISEGTGFRIIGASAGDRLGTAIAIGDINGDGSGDLIVSAPGATTYINSVTGTGRSGAGIVYVLLGKVSRFVDIDLANPSADLALTINGAAANTNAGRTLAIGDVNRDGFQDIVVGTYSQRLYVIFGQSTGFADIDLASFSSDLGFVVSGSSISIYTNYYYNGINIGDKLAATDINKDGYSDMIIGTASAVSLGRSSGAIFVVYGRASMGDIDLGYLNNEIGLMIIGADGDQIGGGSLAVGDVNKDGYGDIAIGQSTLSPMSRSNAGGGYILFGGPNMVDIDLANLKNYAGFNISGANVGDATGSALCIADINQDGFGDIIIGSSSASPLTRSSAGMTSVIYGKATGFTNIDLNVLSTSQGFNVFGQQYATGSGYSLAAGDINGDNVTDMLIGGASTTTVLSGSPGNFTLLPMRLPNISNPILKPLPNVDLNELSLSQGFTISGGISGQLTSSMVAVGNINGDAYADILIGGPSASPLSRSSAGMVSVIWGQAQGQANIVDLISEGTGFRIIGTSAGDRLGTAIAIGDINGDGYGDLIVSAPSATTYINSITGTGRSSAGIVYVLLGKPSGFVDIDLANPSGDLAFTINGPAAYIYAGRALAVGDINRDGFQDIVIATHSQKLYVIFGQSAGFADIDLASLSSDLGFVVSGSSVPYSGYYYYYGSYYYGINMGDKLAVIDINKDGYGDMIIGVVGANPLGRGSAGAIFVVYGRASMGDIDLGYLNNATGLMIMGANAGDQLGGGSLAVGDVNKDGYGDIAIGQSYLSPMSRSNAGGGYILFGGPNMVDIDLANLKNYAGFNISGANTNDRTGSAICIADINQDGFGDIIIGSSSASPLTRSVAGMTSVIYGKATGFTDVDLSNLSASQGFNLFGQSSYTQSGYSLTAGNVRGDNATEVVIGGTETMTVLTPSIVRTASTTATPTGTPTETPTETGTTSVTPTRSSTHTTSHTHTATGSSILKAAPTDTATLSTTETTTETETSTASITPSRSHTHTSSSMLKAVQTQMGTLSQTETTTGTQTLTASLTPTNSNNIPAMTRVQEAPTQTDTVSQTETITGTETSTTTNTVSASVTQSHTGAEMIANVVSTQADTTTSPAAQTKSPSVAPTATPSLTGVSTGSVVPDLTMTASPTATQTMTGTGTSTVSTTASQSKINLPAPITLAFQQAMAYQIPNGPTKIAVADFNQDAILDIAISATNGNLVYVLLGVGDGTFINYNFSYAVDRFPSGIIAADFNRDGIPDIATSNVYGASVSVLLGHGNGTFMPQVAYGVSTLPMDIAYADFNQDAKLDIVTVNSGNGTGGAISVLLGYGDGTFAKSVSYASDSRPISAITSPVSASSVATGDFNGDGWRDVAVTNEGINTVSVFLGRGDGTFATQIPYKVSSDPHDVAIADLNRDGYPDIVTANYGTNNISILSGYGDGTFAQQNQHIVGFMPNALSIADFNKDGYFDIATTSQHVSENSVSVLLGHGNGSFTPVVRYPVDVAPGSLATADFNGDGRSDIITIHLGLNTIYVLLSQDGLSTNHSSVSPSPLVSPSPSPSTSPSSPVVKPCLSYGTSALMTWIETHCHGITKAHQSSMVNALSNNQCQLVMHQSSQYCDTTLSCTLSSQCNPSLTEINLDLSSDAESIYSSGIETAVLASMAMIALDYLL